MNITRTYHIPARWVLVITVSCFVVLYALFIAPMHTLAQERLALQSIEAQLRTELQQEQALRAKMAAIANWNNQLNAWQNPDSGQSTALLGQKLDTWMAMASIKCAPVSRSVGQAQRQGRMYKTPLQVRMRCGMQGLAEILQAIESESPALRIENMEMAANPVFVGGKMQNQGMDITLDLAIYQWQGNHRP